MRHEKYYGNNMINLWNIKDKENDEFIFNFYEQFLFINILVKYDKNHFTDAFNNSRIIILNNKNKIYENILNGHTDCKFNHKLKYYHQKSYL